MIRRLFIFALGIGLVTQPARGQAAAAPPSADVTSLDAIVGALYASISGPKDAPRQWDRFRTLFAPGARLISTGLRRDSSWAMTTYTPEEYITTANPGLTTNGFFEREIARKTDRFGNIVQLFSTYESRRTAADEKPFARGINSIQARFDGQRWWIVTVFWQAENAMHTIPAEYLPGGRGKD
jgi:hypothetical protein